MVDGHLRVAMAITRGEVVPVAYVDLNEQGENFILATFDPITSMAVADQDKLNELLESFKVDFPDTEGLVNMLHDLERAESAPCAVEGEDNLPEEQAVPATRVGDVWLLGSHRVMCGDSTDAHAVSRLLGTGPSPFIMVTDPPYGVEYDPSWRDDLNHGTTAQIGLVDNDDQVDWSKAYRLFPGDVAYIWHAGVYAADVAASIAAVKFQIRAQIIWAKQHFVLSRGSYHWQHEPCWYAVRKGKPSGWKGDRRQSTLWQVPNLNPMGGSDEAKTGHGTQKPVEVMRRPILNHTDPGAAVYDPFLGSGSTLIAAETTGRTCYGMELNPAYVDMTIRRWETMSGAEAVLEGDGQIFNKIATERMVQS